jgi:hypothetical protein
MMQHVPGFRPRAQLLGSKHVQENHIEEHCCWLGPGEALACTATSGVGHGVQRIQI